jgi:hypothetical protein
MTVLSFKLVGGSNLWPFSAKIFRAGTRPLGDTSSSSGVFRYGSTSSVDIVGRQYLGAAAMCTYNTV